MKLNLLLHDDSPRSGFINVDPFAPPEDQRRIRGHFSCLDEIVDDAECDELIAGDILDYVSVEDVDEVLDHWISKLRHGGVITIGGLDLREVTSHIANYTLKTPDANILLFGAQQAPWQFRKSVSTLSERIAYLTDKGLKPLKKRADNYFYSITMERP